MLLLLLLLSLFSIVLEELWYILYMWNLKNLFKLLFWSLFSAVDMPYDSDEEADYSKMDLVGSIVTESYLTKNN